MSSVITPFGGLSASLEVSNQRPLTIATGRTVHSNKLDHREITWAQLCAKIEQPKVTAETLSQYLQMSKEEQSKVKDVGYFIGGKFKAQTRQVTQLQTRDLITLDADHAEPGFIDTCIETLGGCAWAVYQTHKHHDLAPRYRLVIPLSRSVTPDEYEAVARQLAQFVGIEYFDDTTYQAARPMHWPSVSADVGDNYSFRLYEPAKTDGGEHAGWTDPDQLLALYGEDPNAWQNRALWPVSSRVTKSLRARQARAGEPTSKPGLIGAFCRVWDVYSAIDAHLAGAYSQNDPRDGARLTYAGGTTANGAVVYGEGKWLYSHHETDPCSGELVNAWDLVRLHKFGELDHDLLARRRKEGQPEPEITELPSHKAMLGWARELPGIKREILTSDFGTDEAPGAGSPGEPPPSPPPGDEDAPTDVPRGTPPSPPHGDDDGWTAKIELGKQGEIRPTLPNLKVILTLHPSFKDKIVYDLLRHQTVMRGPVPWRHRPDPGNSWATGQPWTDGDDVQLMHWLARKQNLHLPRAKVTDAVLLAADSKHWHPVRDYLSSLPVWDEIPRLEQMLVTHLGAADTEYTRVVTRKTLVAAVARVMRPGCKFDNMLILSGAQGIGKSYIWKLLAGPWHDDSLGSVKGVRAMEQIQGSWIIEMSELAGLSGSAIEEVKRFVAATSDHFRAAFRRNNHTYLRQCVFVGTTNSENFLRDDTGNRRDWPVTVSKRLDFDAFRAQVPQLWAEALYYYTQGEQLHLGDDHRELAEQTQDLFLDTDDGLAGQIRVWADTPVPLDFYDRTDDGDFGAKPGVPLAPRQVLVKREIWEKLMGGKTDTYTQTTARRIGRAIRALPEWSRSTELVRVGGKWGVQKVHTRVGSGRVRIEEEIKLRKTQSEQEIKDL